MGLIKGGCIYGRIFPGELCNPLGMIKTIVLSFMFVSVTISLCSRILFKLFQGILFDTKLGILVATNMAGL